MTKEYFEDLQKLLLVLEEKGQDLASEASYLHSLATCDQMTLEDSMRLDVLEDVIKEAQRAYLLTEIQFITVRNALN